MLGDLGNCCGSYRSIFWRGQFWFKNNTKYVFVLNICLYTSIVQPLTMAMITAIQRQRWWSYQHWRWCIQCTLTDQYWPYNWPTGWKLWWWLWWWRCSADTDQQDGKSCHMSIQFNHIVMEGMMDHMIRECPYRVFFLTGLALKMSALK